MRLVLDTNVLVAAILKGTGVSARVLALVQAATDVTVLYDDRIVRTRHRQRAALRGLQRPSSVAGGAAA